MLGLTSRGAGSVRARVPWGGVRRGLETAAAVRGGIQSYHELDPERIPFMQIRWLKNVGIGNSGNTRDLGNGDSESSRRCSLTAKCKCRVACECENAYSVSGRPGPDYRFDVVHDIHDKLDSLNLSLGRSKTEE